MPERAWGFKSPLRHVVDLVVHPAPPRRMSELIGLVNRLSRATASGRWSGSAGTDDVDKFDLNGLKESEASRLVSAVLGGTSVRNDLRGPGAVDGAYDFTVALPSGRKIALEVTTAANQAMIGTLAALQQMLDGNYPSLRFNWSLTGRHPAAGRGGPRVKAIAGSADNLLRRLEDAQLLSFDEYHPFRRDVVEPDALDAIAQLRRIGVIGAVAMDPVADESEAFVALSLMGGGDPAVDRNQLNLIVAREAESNRRKLERAVADERHLFIWVDSSMFSAELNMHLGHLPDAGPDLPSFVTTAWAALWGPGMNFGWNTGRLWRASEQRSWEVIRLPAKE